MRKLVLINLLVIAALWLNGCGGGTYKQIEVEYPPISPYAKYKTLNLKIIGSEEMDKKEVESFKETIVSALQKREIVITDNKEFPVLTIEILEFSKDSGTKTTKVVGTVLIWLFAPAPPLNAYTFNTIEIRASIKDKEKIVEFKEFQEFKESIKDWEDLKRTVANRIADALYFAH